MGFIRKQLAMYKVGKITETLARTQGFYMDGFELMYMEMKVSFELTHYHPLPLISCYHDRLMVQCRLEGDVVGAVEGNTPVEDMAMYFAEKASAHSSAMITAAVMEGWDDDTGN